MCNHTPQNIKCHVVIDKVAYEYGKKICSTCFQTFGGYEVERRVSEITEIERDIKRLDVFTDTQAIFDLVARKESLMGKVLEYVDKPLVAARKVRRKTKKFRKFFGG